MAPGMRRAGHETNNGPRVPQSTIRFQAESLDIDLNGVAYIGVRICWIPSHEHDIYQTSSGQAAWQGNILGRAKFGGRARDTRKDYRTPMNVEHHSTTFIGVLLLKLGD